MGWVVNATPRPLCPRERPGTRCIGGWIYPWPVWTGAENFAPTGIRSLDRPARSESLYRLSYPSPHYIYIYIYMQTHTHTIIHTQGGPVEIQTPTHWNLTGHSMAVPPPVVSPTVHFRVVIIHLLSTFLFSLKLRV